MVKPPVSIIYEFEGFRLNVAHLMLYRGNEEISLAPKAARTLLTLIERRGEILGKDELMQNIWNDSIVAEANLTQYIHVLRKILGTTADGKPLIETLHRRGYRFNGEVAEKDSTSETSEQGIFQTSIPQTHFSNRTAENKIDTHPERAGRGFTYKMIVLAASICLLILVVSAFWNSQKPQFPVAANPPNVALERLTPDRNAMQPTLSPDGKYLLFANLDKNLTKTLRLRDLTSGSEVEIMPGGEYLDFAFSADGRQIYYLTSDQNSPNSTLERIPLLGGKPQEILKNVISPPAVSPDGKRIAAFKGDTGLTVTDENGEPIYPHESLEDRFNAVAWSSQMSWSPDGERLAICGKDDDGQSRILEFSVKDQTNRYLPIPNFNAVDDAAWLADGSGLLVTAKEKAGEPYQIWRIAYPSGEAWRVTSDFNNYEGISLSQDSKILVAGRTIIKSNLWSMPFGGNETARQITFGSEAQDGYWGMAFAPDGKIIFTSPRSGNLDLWQMNADGSDQQRLTDEGSANIAPRVTVDGKYIVFASTRIGGRFHLWRMDKDGKNPLQLTNGTNADERFFDISPDESRIYYAALNEQRLMTTRKVSIDGGETFALADSYQSSGAIAAAPDGKSLLRYIYLKDQKQPWRFGIFPTDGGEPLKLMETSAYRNIVRWTADGKSFLYIKPTTAQLWRQPTDGQPPVMLSDFKNGWLFNFALSPDHKQIVFAQGNQFSEAVLIENFSK